MYKWCERIERKIWEMLFQIYLCKTRSGRHARLTLTWWRWWQNRLNCVGFRFPLNFKQAETKIRTYLSIKNTKS